MVAPHFFFLACPSMSTSPIRFIRFNSCVPAVASVSLRRRARCRKKRGKSRRTALPVSFGTLRGVSQCSRHWVRCGVFVRQQAYCTASFHRGFRLQVLGFGSCQPSAIFRQPSSVITVPSPSRRPAGCRPSRCRWSRRQPWGRRASARRCSRRARPASAVRTAWRCCALRRQREPT